MWQVSRAETFAGIIGMVNMEAIDKLLGVIIMVIWGHTILSGFLAANRGQAQSVALLQQEPGRVLNGAQQPQQPHGQHQPRRRSSRPEVMPTEDEMMIPLVPDFFVYEEDDLDHI